MSDALSAMASSLMCSSPRPSAPTGVVTVGIPRVTALMTLTLVPLPISKGATNTRLDRIHASRSC